MAQYRKKPVVIKAEQLTEDNWETVNSFCDFRPDGIHPTLLDENGVPQSESGHSGNTVLGIIIPTLEGRHAARIGDWIVNGVKGEFYPVRADIFELIYEAVAE